MAMFKGHYLLHISFSSERSLKFVLAGGHYKSSAPGLAKPRNVAIFVNK